MRAYRTKLVTVFVTTSALVAMTSSIAHASQSPTGADELAAVAAIESVTGTEDLLQVAPGDTSEQVYLPVSGSGVASVTANNLSVSFEQPIADETTTELSAEGTVSYLNEESSYDLHLQAIESPDSEVLSDGLRSLIEIQNADAPTEYVYPVHLDEGVTVAVQEDGSVIGSRGSETVLIVPAPWAVDNAGASVPTSYEVRGNALVQNVEYNSAHEFPIIADPVWFIPLIVAGGRVIGQVAVKAASKAAAKRAAAAIAARTVVKKIVGKIATQNAKKCVSGGAIVGSGATLPVVVQQLGDGRWKAAVGYGSLTFVSAGAAHCLLGWKK